jgi:hypothetical protein
LSGANHKTEEQMSENNPTAPRASTERITVGLTRRNSEDLARLADETGMSKTDIINRALGLYTLMVDKAEVGYKLGFIGPDGENGPPAIEMVHIL